MELTSRGRAAALRLADLVRSLDADEAARSAPGSEWTAIETAAHVVNLYGRALGDRRRSQTPDETAELNAACITEYTERDPRVVADRIAEDAVKVWDEILPLMPDDLEVPFHAGASSTIGPIMGVLLMEMLVHGDDIARACDREWVVGDDDAWCALRAISTLLPVWRRGDVEGSDTVALVGADQEALRIVCDGPETRVTCGHLEATDRVAPETPGDALLGLLGRRPSEQPIADLVARFGPF
ncbi:MAG: maleylpyruvate isomerase N-terminal domain-containing protein [Ilumatobacteraceae bacterium]